MGNPYVVAGGGDAWRAVRLPRPDEVDTLRIEATEPLVVHVRISYDRDEKPVEYSVNRMVAARSEPISYRLPVDP